MTDSAKRNNPSFPPLKSTAKIKCDVVIVGGGITGILSAYMLSKEGKKVILVEKEKIMSGASKDTTAFLTQVIDTAVVDLIKIWGAVKARDVLASHQKAIDTVEEIIKENKIDCSFVRCSNFEYANNKKEFEDLKEEYAATKKLGLRTVLHEQGDAATKSLGFEHYGSLEFMDQAKFDPSLWLYALASLAEKQGAKIYEHSEATSVKSSGGKVEVKVGDIREEVTVEADWALVTTYKPFSLPAKLKFKTGTYTSYVQMFEIKKGLLKEGIYEDTLDPYHYFRVDSEKDFDRVLIGGEDHRSEIPLKEEKNFASLEEYTAKIFKGIERKNPQKWSGLILEPVDGLAYIGSASATEEKNILYATGFSGNGMTYSMISALIFSDIINSRPNSWLNIYGVERKQSPLSLLIKGKDYANEMVGGAIKNIFKRSK